MARTALTATQLTGAYTDAIVTLTMTAADTSNQNSVAAVIPGDIIVFHNTGASTRTVTITSIADRLGRTNDIGAVNILAGAYAVWGPVQLEGWKQSDGALYLESNHADVKIGVLRMP